MAVKITKPLASEQGRLVKRLRTGKTGLLTYQGTEEPEGMVDAPVETLLKQIVKGVKKDPIVIDGGTSTSGIKIKPFTSGVKNEKKSSKPPIPPKPSSGKSGGWKKAVLSGATKGSMKKIGVDPKFVDSFDTDDGGYSPKGRGKGKQPVKAKKTETQKLTEGWEAWDYPLKRGLDYGTDDEDSD